MSFCIAQKTFETLAKSQNSDRGHRNKYTDFKTALIQLTTLRAVDERTRFRLRPPSFNSRPAEQWMSAPDSDSDRPRTTHDPPSSGCAHQIRRQRGLVRQSLYARLVGRHQSLVLTPGYLHRARLVQTAGTSTALFKLRELHINGSWV